MSFIKKNKIGDITLDNFLKNYWQKKPLLIRQAIPGFNSIISAEELAGLSCEENVESRLLVENGLDNKTPWQVINGPQEEAIFSQLPETNWTLLIQEANRHIPQLQELTDYFSFIPNWRFDDVMISYAPKNGSVGPHSDQYDVFLLQAFGQRHWHIADYPTTEADLIPDIDCRILKTFQSQQDWVLNPGDILYLPPGVLHHGVAVNDCQTYSFGFRTGTNGDLLSGILPYAIESGKLNRRYHDPDLKQQSSSGEITDDALTKLEQQLKELFSDKQQLRQWLACYLTETINTDDEFYDTSPLTLTQTKQYLIDQGVLYRNESCRYAYLSTAMNHYQLFINAEEISVPEQLMEFIPVLTGHRILDKKKLSPFVSIEGFDKLIKTLIEKQYLHIDE
jgi:50S ribosomal protein L16 3-hydroxylase